MSTTPFIELKNVVFAYGDRPILHDINFTVEQGNFAAIMGGSGSGKTTLMRLITGQIHPQQGQVLIEGRDAAAWACCSNTAPFSPTFPCTTTSPSRCAS